MILDEDKKLDCESTETNIKISTENRAPPKPVIVTISRLTTRPPTLAKLSRDYNSNSDDNSDDSDSDDNRNDGKYDDDDCERDENSQLEQKLQQANLPEHVKRVVDRELQKLRRTPAFMADYAITRNYLELISELPWNQRTIELIDLRKTRRDLDNDHFGLDKPKERILQYLAVKKLKQNIHDDRLVRASRGSGARSFAQPILMFVGPPGTGKTSIAQSIANSLGRKFHRISLGGITDQSTIRGHRRTYVASMPGRIIQGIKQAGVNNPVFLLDEVDKMSAGLQGDPSGALLEVLDPEQNHTFTDHYLNVAFDLSNVMFIATANSIDSIPAPLRDRMDIIHIPGYTQEEKFNIARRHLVPKQVIESGLKANQIVFKDDAIQRIVSHYAREAGVRQLERRLGTICRVVAVRMVESQDQGPGRSSGLVLPVVVDAASLDSYLGPAPYDRETIAGNNTPGVAVGLAWTATGGEITFVEAEIMKGAKREPLVLTGQLGSVMRESAMLALNWIRVNCHAYDQLPQTLGRDLVDNTVHIHFPAGAVGKDGPSAGVTIVVALMSLCSNMSVVPDLAMTGEITLRGVVLKVGGVKSKVLAAHRAGIRQIILPAKNGSDLSEIPAEIKDKIKFHLVTTIDEVIRIAFDGKLVPKDHFNKLPMDQSRGLTSKL